MALLASRPEIIMQEMPQMIQPWLIAQCEGVSSLSHAYSLDKNVNTDEKCIHRLTETRKCLLPNQLDYTLMCQTKTSVILHFNNMVTRRCIGNSCSQASLIQTGYCEGRDEVWDIARPGD